MNKGEFVAAVAKKADLTQKQAELAYNSMIDVIRETLKKGDSVNLVGFGNYVVKQTAAREGFNPLTKQKIKIPAKKVAAFKFGKSFKESI